MLSELAIEHVPNEPASEEKCKAWPMTRVFELPIRQRRPYPDVDGDHCHDEAL
jgi:hypothetical protein